MSQKFFCVFQLEGQKIFLVIFDFWPLFESLENFT